MIKKFFNWVRISELDYEIWKSEQHLRKAKEVSEQSDLTPKPPFIARFSIGFNALFKRKKV